jgi:hypothetical protein
MDMKGAAEVAAIYRAHCSLPIMVQPNAGLPVLENLKAVYKQLPVDMAYSRASGYLRRREHHRLVLWQHPGPHAGNPGKGRRIQSP